MTKTRITLTRTRTITETATIELDVQPDKLAALKAAIDKDSGFAQYTLAPIVTEWTPVTVPSFRSPYDYIVTFDDNLTAL